MSESSHPVMPQDPMTEADLAAAAATLGLTLTEAEKAEVPALIAELLAGIDALPDPPSALLPARRWRSPEHHEDPCNAFAVLTEVTGAVHGPLAGLRAALKDTISLAGIPLGNGSSLLDGFTADQDAAVVQRLLAAGATIIGKTNCECFCASGASFTGSNGPVLNPWDRTRSAGGSSSGSAVAVATGQADIAIGGDQGGSIRIPAALCGIVGLKPTYGRVSYAGVATVDPALDHIGPMARTTRLVARTLAAIAGPDASDPRSRCALTLADWEAACDKPVAGLRIAAIPEGFAAERADPEVADAVRAALVRLVAAGADFHERSVPLHAKGIVIWMPVILYGTLAGMWTDGAGTGLTRDAMAAMASHLAGWQRRTDELSDVLRILLLAAEAARRRHGFAPYLRGHALGRSLAHAYDAALEHADVLAMPTVPSLTGKLPGVDATITERFAAAVATTGNTAPFNLTGHPAITVPCGIVSGLPVGLMFVARHGDEAALFRAAAAVEAVTEPLFSGSA